MPADPRRRPIVQCRHERRIAKVGPRFRRGHAVLAHQLHASLPLPQRFGPRQRRHADLAQSGERRPLHLPRIRIANFPGLEHERAEAPLVARSDRLLAVIPGHFARARSMCAAKCRSRSSSSMGAAKNMRASRSAPSSSAATMNSDLASACGSAKRAPRPFASRYRPSAPRARPIRSGYASASSTPVHRSGSAASFAPAREFALPAGGIARRLLERARIDADARGQCGIAAQRADAQAQIRVAHARCSAQHVAFAQDGGKVAGQAQRAPIASLDQHVRQPRMHCRPAPRRGHAP